MKRAFILHRSVRDIFEAKITSQFEPDLNEIFNEAYMQESKLAIEDYYNLFIN